MLSIVSCNLFMAKQQQLRHGEAWYIWGKAWAAREQGMPDCSLLTEAPEINQDRHMGLMKHL